MIHRTIRTYIVLYTMIHGSFSLIMGTYILYLLERGLTLFEAHVMNVAWMAGIVLLEVPTGMFADTHGRRRSLLLSCVFGAIGMLFYAGSTCIWMFVVVELFIAIADALESGALDAWFVDRLKELGYTEPLEPIFARKQTTMYAFGIPMTALGGILFSVHISLPWILGGVLWLAAGIIGYFHMHETRQSKQTRGRVSPRAIWQRSREIFLESVRFVRSRPTLMLLFGLMTFCGFVFQAPNMQFQPRFEELFDSKQAPSYVAAGISLFVILGSYLVKRFAMRGTLVSIFVVHGVCGLFVFVAGVGSGAFTVLGLFLAHEVFRGMRNPLKQAAINELIPSERRATILSFESMLTRLGGLLGLLVFGFIGQVWGIPIAWIVSGLLLTAGCVVALLFIRRHF